MNFGAETNASDVMGATRLDGVVVMVTGASGGIGLETARVLASAGATVTLAVRDAAKGDAALAAIRHDHPDANVSQLKLDLTSLASVQQCCETFASHATKLDLLVNNAGVMFPPLLRTVDGFELQFGTNHLGHFALTAGLMKLLLASKRPARVVNVSSGGHAMAGVDLEDPNFLHREYDKFEGYGQSKTANILFGAELDHRYGARGVHAFSLHPGMIATELARYMDGDDFNRLMERAKQRAADAGTAHAGGLPSFKTVQQGAATSIWACIAPELDESGGAYCSDCAVATPEPWASDRTIAEQLWSLSENLTGCAFPQ